MTVDQTANFVRGGVPSSIGSADTTISVDDASIYPDPSTGRGNYNVVIWDLGQYVRPDLDPDVEILRVTGRDTTNDNLTVTRGQENTSAVSHPSSSEIHLPPTSKDFDDIDAKITSTLSVTGSDGLSGGSAELGGSIDVGISGNLSLDSDLVAANSEVIWDESATYIPQGRLENDSITVAGNSVSLGNSTAINHTNLSNINTDDHHVKYTDSEAITAVEGASFTDLDAGAIVEGGTTHLSFDGTGNVEIPNGDLRIATGQAIEDGSGSERFGIDSFRSIVRDGGSGSIQFSITSTNGADLDVDSGKFSIKNQDLRLATGRAIEDGGGGQRFSIDSTATTSMFNGNGDTTSGRAFQASTGGTEIFAHSGTPIKFTDQEGSFTAFQYTTSSSAPGTLELTNASLNLGSNFISNTSYLSFADTDNDGNNWILEDFDGDGELAFMDNVSDGGRTKFLSLEQGGPVIVPNSDLRLAEGQAIEDESGTNRLRLFSTTTQLKDDSGKPILEGYSGTHNRIHSHSGQPLKFYDNEGAFDAVQYDTDSSVGVLRTPNAGVVVESNGDSNTEGLSLKYNQTNGIAKIQSLDDPNTTWKQLNLSGSLIDMTGGTPNLRLATGQAIEDGSGTSRLYFGSSRLSIQDSNVGALAIAGDSALKRVHIAVNRSGVESNALLSLTDDAGKLVEIPNSNLRLATGQSIEDGGGNSRLYFGNDATYIADNAGNNVTYLANGISMSYFAFNNAPWQIADKEGGFNAVKYLTSSSAPGTLELSNAVLEAQHGVTAYSGSLGPIGSSSDPAIQIGNGAGLYVDSNGDVVAVDEGGNTNVLT